MATLGLGRWLLGKAIRLPPRKTRHVSVERALPVAMRDGTVLLADRHYPNDQPAGPVILMRSPYGRDLPFATIAALMAERGFQVVVQSVRGTYGSEGRFDPMRQELADGADTAAWVRAQSWFAGQLFTFGQSYLGNVQWALAKAVPDLIDGMTLMVTLSNFPDELLSGGGFTQAGMLGWTGIMQPLVNYIPGYRVRRPDAHALDQVHGHLPIRTLDEVAFGKTVDWWRDWTDHADPDDPWWQAHDFSEGVPALRAPTAMVAGWRDVFLPQQIRDFEARQATGREASLTIGPWSHSAVGAMAEGLRQAIDLFTACSAGLPPFSGRNRVRLYLQGAGEWREYPVWPPPESKPVQLHLRADGRLELAAPAADEGATGYVYDPADPTPAVHGPAVIGAGRNRDMAELEQRSDSVSYTAAPLARDMDVIGPVSVALSVKSDRIHTDFFVCLCDVDSKGRAQHVSDGYVRLKSGKWDADESGVRQIEIECWPTAYRFKRGHSLRLIVASGAHPRYARNLGTGEPLATATEMVSARQEVLHGPVCGSSITLIEVGPHSSKQG